MIRLNKPGTLTRLKHRIDNSNIGKLFIEMGNVPEAQQNTDTKISTAYVHDELKHGENEVCIAVENTDEYIRVINIDDSQQNLFNKRELAQNIQNGGTSVSVSKDSGIKIQTSYSTTKIINLWYSEYIKDFVGGYYSDVDRRYKAFILKCLRHSRTEEIFYKVYIEDRDDINLNTTVIISAETLFMWERLRIVAVQNPLDARDNELNGKIDNLIISGLLSRWTDQKSPDSEYEIQLDIDTVGKDQLQSWDFVESDSDNKSKDTFGISYDDGNIAMQEILANSNEEYILDDVFNFGVLNQVKENDSNDSDMMHEDTMEQLESEKICKKAVPDYAQIMQQCFEFRTSNIQPLEEYFTENYIRLRSMAVQDDNKSDKLYNDIILRVVEANANKVTDQVMGQGLFNIQDFKIDTRARELQKTKQKAMQFCQELYPKGVEVSLVDMLSVFKVIVPNLFLAQKRYTQFIRQCYQKDGMQLNRNKRDAIKDLVIRNVFNSIDLEQKKNPKLFINRALSYSYRIEGKTYMLQDLGIKALNGFDAQFNRMALGNRFQEQEDMRLMHIVRFK